jgi:hypothetical protein
MGLPPEQTVTDLLEAVYVSSRGSRLFANFYDLIGEVLTGTAAAGVLPAGLDRSGNQPIIPMSHLGSWDHLANRVPTV